jgi:DNA-binding NtrC family response regulator
MAPETLAGLSILVVEDEVLLRKQLAANLEKLGAEVTSVGALAGARRLLADLSLDFALLDVNLPDGLGTDLLREGTVPKGTGVIVMIANGAVSGAVEAMRLGALDYLVKPFDPLELAVVIGRARRMRQTGRADEHRRDEAAAFFFGPALTGVESQLERILAADRRMQESLPPVLIEGETGTGKTSVARWLHQQGPSRASRELVGTRAFGSVRICSLFGGICGGGTERQSGQTKWTDPPSLRYGGQAKWEAKWRWRGGLTGCSTAKLPAPL